MNELKPCPFCGGEADIDAPTGSRNDRLVYCKSCFASICGDATPDAIAAWNRRHEMPKSMVHRLATQMGWSPPSTPKQGEGE